MADLHIHPVTAEATGRLRDDQVRFQQTANLESRYFPGQTACVGRCSLCGGPVVVPTLWAGAVPPVPTCSSCGATAAPLPQNPVIEMEPRR